MKTRNLLMSVLVGLGVASCGENPPPATTDKPALTNPKPYGEAPPTPGAPQIASATPVRSGAPAQPTVNAIPSSPVPPKDAQWTIACDTLDGPAHVMEAALRKQQLIEASHMSGWYVVHSDNKSEIFYGYYGDQKNPAEKARQESDRRQIAGLLDRLGNPMVRSSVLAPVSMPDPAAPADWNLLNTPHDAYWTIEFATFVDGRDLRDVSVDRKQAAVELVRYYREEKHRTDVFYYHGPTVSSVCVGAWKREAMAEQGTRTDAKGQMRDDANTQSADQSLLVMVGLAPGNMPSRVTDPNTGKAMAVQGMKRDVVDPNMKAAMVEFKDHLVNMHLQYGEGGGDPISSMIVQIPHGPVPTAVTDDNWRLSGGQTAPVQPRQQGGGDDILRSIGSH